MATAELDVWTAISNILQNNAGLISFIPDGTGKARVRDAGNIPSGYQMPYVVLGEDASSPKDTFAKDGQDILATIHLWSAYKGKYEVLRLHNLVHSALNNQPLILTSNRCISCLYDTGEVIEDDSTGVNLMHHTGRYRVITEEL